MADAFLLESGGTDRYLLEDGSGVYLNEVQAVAYEVTVDDGLGLGDSLVVAHARNLPADTVGLVDTATPVLTVGGVAHTVTVDDTAGLVDTLAYARDLALTDSAGLTDPRAVHRDLALTDSVGLADDTTRAVGRSVTVDDTVGLVDTRAIHRDLAVTDSAGMADTLAYIRDLTVTDAAGVTDNLATARDLALTDDLGLTDTNTPVHTPGGGTAHTVTVNDTVGLGDSLAVAHRHQYNADTVGLVDTLAFTRSLVVTDSLGLTDTNTPVHTGGGVAHTVTITDDVGLRDSAGFYGGGYDEGYGDGSALVFDQHKTFTDSVGLTDTVSPVHTPGGGGGTAHTVTVNDSVGLVDTRAFTRDLTVTDTVGLTDAAAPVTLHTVTIDDLVGLTDTTHRSMLRLTDTVGLTDEILIQVTRRRRILRTPILGLDSVGPYTPPKERGLMRHYAGYPKRGVAVIIWPNGTITERRVLHGDEHLTAAYVFPGGRENVVDETAAAILEAAGYTLIDAET